MGNQSTNPYKACEDECKEKTLQQGCYSRCASKKGLQQTQYCKHTDGILSDPYAPDPYYYLDALPTTSMKKKACVIGCADPGVCKMKWSLAKSYYQVCDSTGESYRYYQCYQKNGGKYVPITKNSTKALPLPK